MGTSSLPPDHPYQKIPSEYWPKNPNQLNIGETVSTKEEDEEIFITIILWVISPITWPIGWVIRKLKRK